MDKVDPSCVLDMKILFLISSFQAGGAERVGSWLVGKLAGAGHEVVAATLSSKEFFYTVDPRIKVVKLGVTRSPRGPLDAFASARRRLTAVDRLVRAEAPALVLSFMTAPNLLAIGAAHRSSVPVIVAERNSRRAAIVTSLQDLARRLYYPFANAVVLQTEADRAAYPFLKNSHVIPNPVVAPVAEERSRSQMILAAGRLERQKGFDLLLEAFSRVGHKEGWRLVFAGEGDEHEALEAQAERLGISGIVDFLGRRTDMPDLYADASIFCLSSRYEGFPNVLVEAMSAGCAVVATDCPTGPREIINDGVDGLLVPTEDVGALTGALGKLISDQHLRESLGESAMIVQERFGAQKIAAMWETLINGVIEPQREGNYL